MCSGGRTGDGVRIGVELLELRGGAVQRRFQLLEFRSPCGYSEEALPGRHEEKWQGSVSFFHMSHWLVSIPSLKKCVQKQWGKQKRKQMKSRVQQLTESAEGDVALSGREADRRTASVASINTTNLSLKGLLAGSLVNMANLKKVTVNN